MTATVHFYFQTGTSREDMHARLLKHVACTRLVQTCLLRTTQRSTSILDEYANAYRPEVESELEHLAVQTTKNRSLQVDYELE